MLVHSLGLNGARPQHPQIPGGKSKALDLLVHSLGLAGAQMVDLLIPGGLGLAGAPWRLSLSAATCGLGLAGAPKPCGICRARAAMN